METGTDIETGENLVAFVQDLINESEGMRGEFTAKAQLNLTQFLGDYNTAKLYGHSHFSVNKTLNAVIAHTQVQIEKRPRTTIVARESGRSVEYWMTRSGLESIRAAIAAGQLQVMEDMHAEVDPSTAIIGEPEATEDQGFVFTTLDQSPASSFAVTESFVQRVSPLTMPWQGMDGVTYQPLLRPTDIVPVTDQMAADVTETNLGVLWDLSDGDAWLTENVYNTNILGWQFWLYQWDPVEQCDSVTNLHPYHVWLPSEATCVEDADHVIVREPMTKDAAKKRYPQLSEQIDKFAENGSVMGDAMSGQISSAYQSSSARQMVNVWTAWFRNHEYEMTPDDALADDRVIASEQGFVLLDGDGNPGEPTAPGQANWPRRSGVRQVQIIAAEVVADEECPYMDIPMGQNKDIPIPFRWTAQGEPERLESVSRMLDKLGSIIADHVGYYRSEQEIFPSDVWHSLGDQRAKMHSHPGRQMVIDSALFMKYPQLQNGKGFGIEPPAIPEAVSKFWESMLRLHDELSGNTAELQGRASNASLSGVAIENLQTAARGLVGFKATQTERTLKRLARLRIHATTKRGWLSLAKWKKWNDSYSVEALDAIRSRAKECDFDVAVEISSGGGELRRAQQQQVREDFGAGLIDIQTALDKLDYEDAEQIVQRLQSQQQMQQATAVQSSGSSPGS